MSSACNTSTTTSCQDPMLRNATHNSSRMVLRTTRNKTSHAAQSQPLITPSLISFYVTDNEMRGRMCGDSLCDFVLWSSTTGRLEQSYRNHGDVGAEGPTINTRLSSRQDPHRQTNFKMPGDNANMAKDIAVGVAGSIGGNKVADKLHLGNVGHIAGGIGGGIAANDAEHKLEEKKD